MDWSFSSSLKGWSIACRELYHLHFTVLAQDWLSLSRFGTYNIRDI